MSVRENTPQLQQPLSMPVQLALLPKKGFGARAVQVLTAAACAEAGGQAAVLRALVEPHHLAVLTHMACSHPLCALDAQPSSMDSVPCMPIPHMSMHDVRTPNAAASCDAAAMELAMHRQLEGIAAVASSRPTPAGSRAIWAACFSLNLLTHGADQGPTPGSSGLSHDLVCMSEYMRPSCDETQQTSKATFCPICKPGCREMTTAWPAG